MSRGQLARTRANFPRMKDRAAGRRIRRGGFVLAPGAWRAFMESADRLSDHMRAVGRAADRTADGIRGWADAAKVADEGGRPVFGAPTRITDQLPELGEETCRECGHDHADLDLSCACCLHLVPDLT